MTTPTREQVVHPDALPELPPRIANGNLGVCYYDGFQMQQYAMRYAEQYIAARADLEAKVAELEAEVALLHKAIDAKSVLNLDAEKADLRQQLAASQALENGLRDALESCPAVYHAAIDGKPCTCGMCEFLRKKDDALSTPTDNTALREYCAEKVETMKQDWYSSSFKGCVEDFMQDRADKIRKGEAL